MSDDSFLREVEEELRSDKLKAFWRRFAPFIIGGAVLIVVLVAANEAWKWWRESTAATASDQYYAAIDLIDAGDLDAAQTELAALVEQAPGGYAALARFKQAALLAEQGQPEAAIEAYDDIAATAGEQSFRELARIMGAYLAVDFMDLAAVESRTEGLDNDLNPLGNNAREALGLANYKAGNVEEARAQFELIAADPGAAQDLQLRAFVYLEQLASTGVPVDEQIVESIEPELTGDAAQVQPEAEETSSDLDQAPADAENQPAPNDQAAAADGEAAPEPAAE